MGWSFVERNITYTDVIVNEILNKNIDEEERMTYINSKYYNKVFTLIAVRKEKKIVAERMNDNAVNKFDMVNAGTLCVLSGITSYLLGDKLLKEEAALKVFFPLITISILFVLFSTLLINMKEKNQLYKMCNEKLVLIEKRLEEEYAIDQLRKIVDKSYLEGSIVSRQNKDIREAGLEIEAFKFDSSSDEKVRKENSETSFGVA